MAGCVALGLLGTAVVWEWTRRAYPTDVIQIWDATLGSQNGDGGSAEKAFKLKNDYPSRRRPDPACARGRIALREMAPGEREHSDPKGHAGPSAATRPV